MSEKLFYFLAILLLLTQTPSEANSIDYSLTNEASGLSNDIGEDNHQEIPDGNFHGGIGQNDFQGREKGKSRRIKEVILELKTLGEQLAHLWNNDRDQKEGQLGVNEGRRRKDYGLYVVFSMAAASFISTLITVSAGLVKLFIVQALFASKLAVIIGSYIVLEKLIQYNKVKGHTEYKHSLEPHYVIHQPHHVVPYHAPPQPTYSVSHATGDVELELHHKPVAHSAESHGFHFENSNPEHLPHSDSQSIGASTSLGELNTGASQSFGGFHDAGELHAPSHNIPQAAALESFSVPPSHGVQSNTIPGANNFQHPGANGFSEPSYVGDANGFKPSHPTISFQGSETNGLSSYGESSFHDVTDSKTYKTIQNMGFPGPTDFQKAYDQSNIDALRGSGLKGYNAHVTSFQEDSKNFKGGAVKMGFTGSSTVEQTPAVLKHSYSIHEPSSGEDDSANASSDQIRQINFSHSEPNKNLPIHVTSTDIRTSRPIMRRFGSEH